MAPAHVQAIDFDGDGDKDLMVAVLGMLFPNNDKIGTVVVLENDGHCHFTRHVIVDKVARVSDVRAGDLGGDGDMDMAVAQFGYDDGETPTDRKQRELEIRKSHPAESFRTH